MTTQHWKCTWCYGMVHFKMVKMINVMCILPAIIFKKSPSHKADYAFPWCPPAAFAALLRWDLGVSGTPRLERGVLAQAPQGACFPTKLVGLLQGPLRTQINPRRAGMDEGTGMHFSFRRLSVGAAPLSTGCWKPCDPRERNSTHMLQSCGDEAAKPALGSTGRAAPVTPRNEWT